MFEHAVRTVASTNDVAIVVYEESASDPTVGHRPIVFSHATGFHGRVFSPVARRLSNFPRITFDYRGYGDTAAPTDWALSWEGFGDDALVVARDTWARYGRRPVIAAGHSMGGAGLVMAALREPQLFAALVLFEPIIFPPEVQAQAGKSSPLAEVTRRRRRTFASHGEALANFAAKPPLAALDAEALEAYVRHGFANDASGVRLKCDPEFEARTYEMGAQHGTWSRLGELVVPTWIMAGSFAPNSPAAIAPRLHELIPNSTFVEWSDLGHFGPLEDPARFAAFLGDIASQIADS